MSNAIEGLKLCQEIATLTPQHSREINSWYQGMKLKTGKTLASLQVRCYCFSVAVFSAAVVTLTAWYQHWRAGVKGLIPLLSGFQ